MSRFVAMFTKLAADAEEMQQLQQPVLSRERVRLFLSSSSSSSSSRPIDHSDALRQKLLRSKIVQRAQHIMSLDRRSSSSSSWNLPPPLPYSLDGCTGGTKTHADEAQSIAANNAALDMLLFGDSLVPSQSPSKREARLFCSKQPKIRKIE
ncbi:hypothetical protein PFISCL1PPCAC_23578, partial [Pristionchus fissidentatus]